MQVGRSCDGGVSICCDLDLIAFGNLMVVIVDVWPREQYRPIDMCTPVTKEMKGKLPLYYYFHKYGWCVIHWWAAALGCDISPEDSGLVGIRRATYVQALCEFDKERAQELNLGGWLVANAALCTAQRPFPTNWSGWLGGLHRATPSTTMTTT